MPKARAKAKASAMSADDPGEPTKEQVAAAMCIWEALPDELLEKLRPHVLHLENSGVSRERTLATVIANIDYYAKKAPSAASSSTTAASGNCKYCGKNVYQPYVQYNGTT